MNYCLADQFIFSISQPRTKMMELQDDYSSSPFAQDDENRAFCTVHDGLSETLNFHEYDDSFVGDRLNCDRLANNYLTLDAEKKSRYSKSEDEGHTLESTPVEEFQGQYLRRESNDQVSVDNERGGKKRKLTLSTLSTPSPSSTCAPFEIITRGQLYTIPINGVAMIDKQDIDNGWRTYHDENGIPYHYNFRSGESVWASTEMSNTIEANENDNRICDRDYDDCNSWNPKVALGIIRNSRQQRVFSTVSHERNGYYGNKESKHWTNYSRYHRQKRQSTNYRDLEYGRDKWRRQTQQRRRLREKLFSKMLATPEGQMALNQETHDIMDMERYGDEMSDDFEDCSSTSSLESENADDAFADKETLALPHLVNQLTLWREAFSRFIASRMPLLTMPTIVSSLIASTKTGALLVSEWTRNHFLPKPNQK